MKILICNIALRPTPDPFPPVACTSLYNILKDCGYTPEFYDIDARRPSFAQLSDFFKKNQFDIVGISAVVSTGYKFTKELAAIIKAASPKTQIILGGNLAAAHEILLNKCDIDICVIGEGEKVLLNLVRHYEKYKSFDKLNPELSLIKGIAYLTPDGKSKFSGYEQLLPAEEIQEPDYELLDRLSDINKYILSPLSREDFVRDRRSYETKKSGMKMATIFTSKGCINKCTFCHRWVRGYRIIPVQKVIDTIKYLKEKYNVGFFCISDECFGENEQWLREFIRLVRPLDILFQVGGARVSIMKRDPMIFSKLKEVGLTAIYFGMESGSEKILKIMAKNATSAENLEAARICAESGVHTVIQLVIGMPGENEKTINETIDFVREATGLLPDIPELSINYLQALPGTPCYEYLRKNSFLGQTLGDEEEYLIKISNINATEFKQYINVSEEPLAKVKTWKMKIYLLTRINWLNNHGWKFPDNVKNQFSNLPAEENLSFLKKIKAHLKTNILVYKAIDFFGEGFWKMIFIKNSLAIYGFKRTFYFMLGLSSHLEDRSKFKIGPERIAEFSKMRGIESESGENYQNTGMLHVIKC